MAIGGGGGFPGMGNYNEAIMRRLIGLRPDQALPFGTSGSAPSTGTMGTDPATGVSNNLTDIFKGAIANGDPNLDPNAIVDSPFNSVTPATGNNAPGMIPPTASLIKGPTGNYKRTGTPPPPAKKKKPPMVSGTVSATKGRAGAIKSRLAGIAGKKRASGGY